MSYTDMGGCLIMKQCHGLQEPRRTYRNTPSKRQGVTTHTVMNAQSRRQEVSRHSVRITPSRRHGVSTSNAIVKIGPHRLMFVLILFQATLMVGSNPEPHSPRTTATGHDTKYNFHSSGPGHGSTLASNSDRGMLNSHLTNANYTDNFTVTTGWSNCSSLCTCDVNTQTVSCFAKDLHTVLSSISTNVRHFNFSKCNYNFSDLNTYGVTETTPNRTTQGSAMYQNVPMQLDGLESLKYLQTLDLSCNNLSDLDLSHFPANLTRLYLTANAIPAVSFRSLHLVLPKLELLDLRSNYLQELTVTTGIDNVTGIFYRQSNLQDNFTLMDHTHSSMVTLLLSGNQINTIDADVFAWFPSLRYVDLSANNIHLLTMDVFINCSNLMFLNLAENEISNLPSNIFKGLGNLRELNLAGLQLRAIHDNTLSGLEKLRHLNLSNNARLGTIHADSFRHLRNLATLDLTNCNLRTLYEPIFNNLQSEIRLNGNPWQCDCNLQWLLHHNYTLLKDSPTCYGPPNLHGYSLLSLSQKDSCTGAFIVNISKVVSFKLGSPAILDCVADGDPSPAVTWRTPSGQVFHYNPAYVNYERSQPSDAQISHNGLHYVNSGASKRWHLLANGSLFIDYITRGVTGSYTCIVGNRYGNDTAFVEVTLEYADILTTVLWTNIVGLCAAASFLTFGILLCIVRNITSSFKIKHQEDTNRKFKGMLDSISDYKSVQIGRLSAYKSAQLVKLSAFKNSKKNKFHLFSRPSMGSAFQHMHSMREHYSTQIDVIKDNCAEKGERLRENYTFRLQRFRDYKSDKVGKLRGYKEEKIDRLRENYTHQAQKIREYGSQQMARLRSSYKLQQHYVLKLYELLDIGNCMTVIEAECMRTESMLFDDNFMTLDLETHPVHIQINLSASDDDDDSYYVTASSQSDGSEIVCKQDDVRRDESLGESVSDDLGQEDINFNDLHIQHYPPHLNFLESIELESTKYSKRVAELKLRKTKQKLKKQMKKLKDQRNLPQKQSLRKTNPKSAQRRAKTKANLSQGTDTDSENDLTILKTENEKLSPRKSKYRAKQMHKPVHLDIEKYCSRLDQYQCGILLNPGNLRTDILFNDDDGQSIYESAQASTEHTPKLGEHPHFASERNFNLTSLVTHPKQFVLSMTPPDQNTKPIHKCNSQSGEHSTASNEGVRYDSPREFNRNSCTGGSGRIPLNHKTHDIPSSSSDEDFVPVNSEKSNTVSESKPLRYSYEETTI